MKKIYLFLIGALFCFKGFTQKIVYVDQNAVGNNDGSSWTDAYSDFQTAVNNSSTSDTVWVKEGVYIPQGTDRTASFNLSPGIVVLGGFKGNETQSKQRNFVNNLTILSGNIGDESLDSDNSYHVLNLSYCDGSQLDGFHIQEGRANGSYPGNYGGGIYMYNAGTITFSNCVIENNTGTYGGGVCIDYKSNAKFYNVIFTNNSASSYGSGIHSFWATPLLVNCVITQNPASSSVLCSYNSNINWQLVNTTISGNEGGNCLDITGGGSLTAINCIIDGAATGNIECSYSYKSGSVIYGEGNITGETGFYDNTDPLGPDGLWFTSDDGLQLAWESPARNAGSNSATIELEKDIQGIIRKNGNTVDMGAYEFNSNPVFSNQTIKASTYLSNGDFVGSIEATDPDSTELIYEILSGADIFYNIDENTGSITINDISSLDNSQEHETDISIRVHDIVSYTDAMVTVKLLPRNAPFIEDGLQFTIDENPAPGSVVGTINATAGDITPISYLILNGNDERTFSIDENTGNISVLDNTKLNYEENNELWLEAGVTDGELISKSSVRIVINDVNEAPETLDYRVFISQSASNSTIVGNVPAFDPESGALEYSIESGDDLGIFSINENAQIVLEKNNFLDFKSVPSYQLVIAASDGVNVNNYEVIVDIEAPVNHNIIYVNKTAYGENDGSSWLNAYTDLQTAINNSSSGDSIWVKEGEYTPQGNMRSASLNLRPGIIVLGGFIGNEVEINQRDLANNITILSGNIGDKDLDSDNSYHVLNLASCSGSQLDGFYIQEGLANGASYDYRGGGINMYNSGSVTFSNCVIKNNLATYGGGVCIDYNSNAKFINVIFQGNSTNYYGYGGAIQSFTGNTELINCVFTENYGNRGILCSYNSGITWQLTNTTFYGNTGGACLDITGGGSSTIVNSIIVGSISGTNTCTYTYKNGTALTGESNITGDINFLDETNPIGSDGLWFTDDDGLQLIETSPGIDAGSATAVSTIETDIVGGERSRGINPDLGAYEFNRAPVINNTTSFSINVYEAAGTLVSTFTASDPQSDVITYSIESGNISNAFELGTNNGELRVNNSDALNYSATPVFNLIIKASDGSFSDTTRVIINLNKLEAEITLANNTVQYNGSEQVLTATTNPTGLSVVYTYNGSTEPPVDADLYSIQATINDDTYKGTANATLTIEKAQQTISFAPIEDKTYGDASFQLIASGGNSGNPVVFESSDTKVAAIEGNLATIVGSGTATITATQEGNENYLAAVPAEQTLNVSKANAELAFEDATYTYNGTAKTIPFSIVPDSLAGYVTVEFYINEEWIQASPANSGSYQVRASFEHPNYIAETKTATLTIEKAAQTITFALVEDKAYGDEAFKLTANGGNSGNPVVFESSDKDIATIQGNMITIVSAGTTTITARQESDENYLAATPVEQILNVAKAKAELTFEDAIYTYDGTAKSVPFSIVPDSLINYVTIEYYINEEWTQTPQVNSGDYEARASFAHPNYEAETKIATLKIEKIPQTITFIPIEDKIYGDATFELTASGGNSGNPFVFESSDTDVAIIAGNLVTIVGAGITTITATQEGNENYLDAIPVEQTINVNKASATLSLGEAVYTYDGMVKTSPFSVSPDSLTHYVIIEYYINDEWSLLPPIDAGSYETRTSFTHPNYRTEEKTSTLQIEKAPQSIIFESIEDRIYGDASFELSASGGSSFNPVIFISSDTDVATVKDNFVTIVGAGTTTITATQKGNKNYESADQTGQTLIVKKAVPEIIEWPLASDINVGNKLSVSSLTGGEASIQGVFVFSTPDTVLSAGIHEVSVRFEAREQTNYTNVEGLVTVDVLLINKVKITDKIDVKVYPNPATDFIQIKGIKTEQYSIVNISGETIEQGFFNNSSTIDISSLRHGTYFLFINEKHVVKFVKY